LVLAAVSEPVTDTAGLQHLVDLPPVYLSAGGRREVAVVPSARAVIVIETLPRTRDEVVIDLDEPVGKALSCLPACQSARTWW
jgi:ABC-type transport system involved in cytochrome c biogenesis ATPase subunit